MKPGVLPMLFWTAAVVTFLFLISGWIREASQPPASYVQTPAKCQPHAWRYAP